MLWIDGRPRPDVPVRVAATRSARRRGLLGRATVAGGLVLAPCRQVHTIGMRVPIDAVFVARDGRVLRIAHLAPGRVSRPVWRSRWVLEGPIGGAAAWGIRVGTRLEVREHAGHDAPAPEDRRGARGGGPMSGEGALVLVATPIGNLGDLSPRAVEALRTADVVAAEDTRRTRALLTHAGIPAGARLVSVHEHNERARAAELVERIRRGARVVLVTDAGTPGISDPGERLVRVCVDAGVRVETVPGPSAVLAALVVSGLPTARFVMEGFLPRSGRERTERLAAVAGEPRTTVLFEAPHRVAETLADLARVCGGDRPVAVARELTKRFESVWRGTLLDAVAHVAAEAPRGEHVLVVGGAPPAAEPDDAAVRAAVERHLAAGASARDAAAEVAASLGVPKRRAYEIATELRHA